MDVDESRYVSMARDMFNSKDYLTLYLNNEYFFEKPPLYFWSECLSFKIFGEVNEFTARFPVALYGMACCFLVYVIGRKIVSRAYGVIASLILATSLEFLILAKFAILDIVVSTCVSFSICLGIIIYYCRESHKKYYWWLFYAFSGLAVMAKGIPGFIIPFGSMFMISLISGQLKDCFKPINMIPGILVFSLIVLPWHIVMFKIHNPAFWDEYIIKHHLARFMGADLFLFRQRPFYYYIVTILWGFFPWIISSLIVWGSYIHRLFKQKLFKLKFSDLNNTQKLILFNTVVTLFIMIFFSSSGTKLITYILPIYVPLAFLTGYIWWNFLNNGAYIKFITASNYIIGSILLIATIAGILTPLYLPEQLLIDISSVKTFCILLIFSSGLALILFTKKKLYIASFATLILLMTILSAFATEKFFEIDYKFGQDDLMEFAKYAKDKDITLSTFSFGHKYSLVYYGEKPVSYNIEVEPYQLYEILKKDKNLVIIKLRDINNYKDTDFDIIKRGRKYALIDEVNHD